jgi:tetratricopeptide (TPR) repeat protein
VIAGIRWYGLLTHSAIGVCGIILGVALLQWFRAPLRADRSLALGLSASQAYHSGQQDKAIILLSQAMAVDPDNYDAIGFLAKIYSDRGDSELAIELYQQALRRLDRRGGSHVEREVFQSAVEQLRAHPAKQGRLNIQPR